MRKFLRLAAFAAFLMPAATQVVQAQPAGGSGDSSSYGTTDDNRTDWGWIGLFGLAGLLGLRRREPSSMRSAGDVRPSPAATR